MSLPKVSVIVPTYNGADHLRDAIQSVLGQTYPNFELLVVNDGSPDDTDRIIKRFNDPRLVYLVHEQNQGVDAARKTGLEISNGEIIAFLDQDDIFHPEKLAAHVAFLQAHPHIGFSYNSFFNLDHSANTVRDISRPPKNISLNDLVFGFPLPPSVMVLRRDWALREELWDEKTYLRGREIVFCGRLFMAGCQFGMVERVLNYRRYHAGRIFGNLEKKCADERACQDIIFNDARCPSELLDQRDIASSNIYMLWAYVAFAQDEVKLGQQFVRHAVELNPLILQGSPSELTRFFLMYAIDEEHVDHSDLLQEIFNQFPEELSSVLGECDWAIGQGSLLKGIRSIIWGRKENGRFHFEKAQTQHAQLDTFTTQALTTQLMNFEVEFGVEATNNILNDLIPYLKMIGNSRRIKSFKGNYAVNRAFRSYEEGQYKAVPKEVIQAIVADPNYLINRGVLSILFRSSMNLGISNIHIKM